MEVAAATRVEAPPADGARPPQVPLPRVLQTARFLIRPIPFFERWRRVLGETFAARLFGPGDVVFVSDPESLKRLFGADRVNTIAPGRNIVLKPLLGHQSFAIHPHMQAITLEVIMRAVFGVSDAARRDELRRNLVAILAESASPSAIGLVFGASRRLPHYREFARRVERTDELLASEIAERRADPELESREDILSMLIAARFEDGSEMSDGELRDQLMTLLLAGHETTATGLAWAFDLLLHTPPTLDRLRADLDAGETAYLDAVVNESLRVRPVVPFTGRLLHEGAHLGGYDHEPGTTVLAAIYMAHTNPDLFPDPFAFRPERFLDEAPDTFSWIPFGGGTRRCIGAAFAQMEMRVALRTIVESVKLEAADPRPEKMTRRNVTLSPRGGVRVVANAAA
jgi:cytochrome P450 family 135